MTFDEYIPKAVATAVFTDPRYPYFSLTIETAELIDVFVKPLLRGDNNGEVDRDKVVKEAGDCYWNLAAICSERGYTLQVPSCVGPFSNRELLEELLILSVTGLRDTTWASFHNYRSKLVTLLSRHRITESEVLEANLKKLADRAARGVLKGSGGER